MALEPRDVMQLYHETYVEYQGNLKYAVANGEDAYVTLRDLFNREPDIRVLADPDTVTSPINYRLGYLNNNEGDVYVARLPVRNYSIGWSNGNTNGHLFSAAKMKKSASTVLKQLRGEYPNFRESVELATATGRTVAFARDFAVHRGGTDILYRDRHLASLRTGSGEWICIGNRHSHMFDLFNSLKEA